MTRTPSFIPEFWVQPATPERLQAALIMIAMVPIVLVCPFVLRYSTTELTLASVKE